MVLGLESSATVDESSAATGWIRGSTVVVAVAELLPGLCSAVLDAAVAVFVTVPLPIFGSVRTTTVNVAPAVATNVGFENVTVPDWPTSGVEADHPSGAVTERNVVFAGSGSVSVADEA